jgi:hypothetical protein
MNAVPVVLNIPIVPIVRTPGKLFLEGGIRTSETFGTIETIGTKEFL